MLTVAVTNRPQVAKGLVTFEDLDHILGRLEALLAEDGGVLDRIYFCPHHPDVRLSRRDCGAEDPLRMPQARHAAVAAGARRYADRSAPIQHSSEIACATSALRAVSEFGPMGCAPATVAATASVTGRENGTPPIPDLMFETVPEAVKFRHRIPRACGARAG